MSSVANISSPPSVHRLSNGVTVALETLPYVHSVSVGVWIKTGSINESSEQAGVSHFLEHMLFKGTETRTPREIMDAIESKGGHLNAFTSREYTCYYAKTLSDHVSTSVDVLSDIMQHAIFQDLEKERNVILEEIHAGDDVPEEAVQDLLMKRLWPDHAAGRPIAGFAETVEAMPGDVVRGYLHSWYRPENIWIVAVGQFDEEELFVQIDGAFGSMERGSPPERGSAPEFSAGVAQDPRDIAQNHIAFAFPGAPLTHENRYAYDLLGNITGGGSTSRLFERIREEQGLAYSIYAYHSPYEQAGVLGVYAAVAPENFQKTLDIACGEFRNLIEEQISGVELNGNREQLKGGLLLALENTFNRMTRIARGLMFYGRVIPVQEILDRIDAVTANDIQTLAQEVFVEDHCALAVVGPEAETVRLPIQTAA